jgi:hypothetical protein
MANKLIPKATTAIEPTTSLESRLLAEGFTIPLVTKKAAIEDADQLQPTEMDVINLIAKDGFADPEAEFQALFQQFGLTAYADKKALASEGTRFRVSQVVRRKDGGYNGDTDWGMTIVTEYGEPQMLTFEANPGRDRFLTVMAFYCAKRGVSPFCTLQAFTSKNGSAFYAIMSAKNDSSLMKLARENGVEPTTYDAETYDAESA